MPVECFLQWIKKSENLKEAGSLSLPPVQRTALWRPRQILDFWDSLFCGMPIGLFYLTERKAGSPVHSLENSKKELVANPVDGFNLLDGQQRTRALMLATSHPLLTRRCIWIDLAAKPDDGIPKLLLTAESQPFGYSTEGVKLPLAMRREARRKFDETSKLKAPDPKVPFYDHQLFEEEINRAVSCRERPWPPPPFDDENKAKFVPLHEVMIIYKKYSDDEASFDRAVNNLLAGNGFSNNIIFQGLRRFRKIEIALQIVKFEDNENNLILKLFERIGSGGTPLSENERLYSIYKHYVPAVQDAVEAIENVPKCARLMSATMIANTALRIAQILKPDGELAAPSPSKFVKIMNNKIIDEPFRTQLEKLLPVFANEKSGKSLLQSAFRTVSGSARYEKETHPNGIPSIMLAKLPIELLQVLIYWAALIEDTCAACHLHETVPMEIVRFILFWRLCVFSDLQAGRQAIKWIKEHIDKNAKEFKFPGLSLYKYLTGQPSEHSVRCAIKLFTPEDFTDLCKENSKLKKPGYWLSHHERFERSENPEIGKAFRAWWESGSHMLLWLQRAHLTSEFADYNPLNGQDDDAPFDLDHLQPQSFFTNLPKQADFNAENLKPGRYVLLHSIGNLRWIGSAQNRSDGAIGLAKKLALERFDQATEHLPDEWMKAVFDCGPDAIKMWKAADASKDGGAGWTAKIAEDFQEAVESRTLWLYEKFYIDARFKEWLETSPSEATDYNTL